MKNGIFTGLFIVYFLMTGCSSSSSTALKGSADMSASDKIDQFIKNGFETKLGRTRKKIIHTLGKPEAIHVEKAKKSGIVEEINDEIYELVYDGLTITIYRAAHENEDLLQHISLTSSVYKVKWGLNIGTTKNTVLSVLGKPSDEDEFSYMYQTQSGIDSSVRFFFKDDIVNKIDWWYSID